MMNLKSNDPSNDTDDDDENVINNTIFDDEKEEEVNVKLKREEKYREYNIVLTEKYSPEDQQNIKYRLKTKPYPIQKTSESIEIFFKRLLKNIAAKQVCD